MTDEEYMQQAIDLAWQGLYSTSPNPRVGCVLVKNQQIVGQGYHVRTGEGHAEVIALAECHHAQGATAYVTLEPCSHMGKTPPCCDALIEAKVSRVVIAMQDPNPQVSGRGIDKLRAASIQVDVGVLEDKARLLNPGFIQRMTLGRPYITVKLAMSLDGRTAMANGESQWITGADARSDVQRLRARSCAIVSGIDTIINDDASLTVRANELGLEPSLTALATEKQPLRVVLDSTLKIPLSSKVISQAGSTTVVTCSKDTERIREIEALGVQVLCVKAIDGRVDLSYVIEWLANQQCNEILIEAGATLAGAFWQQGFVDHLLVYMAPTLMGNQARGLFNLPLQHMHEQQRLHITSIEPVGSDWRIEAEPRKL